MNTFKLIISSPDGNVFDGEVSMLTIRGTEGELAIMAGHIPFVTSVMPCDCNLTLPDGSEKSGHIEGGILTVSKSSVILLSGSFKFN